MNGKHTPGPWIIDHSAEPDLKGHVLISTSGGSKRKSNHIGLAHVVWVMEDDASEGKNSPVCEANARLIAAAPDLLATLEQIARGEYAEGQEVEMAKTAIAKARGDA